MYRRPGALPRTPGAQGASAERMWAFGNWMPVLARSDALPRLLSLFLLSLAVSRAMLSSSVSLLNLIKCLYTVS